MQLDEAGLVRMRRMLRHRLLNFVSGVKSANMLLASELDDRLDPREREYFSMIQKECDLITFMTDRLETLFATLPPAMPALLGSAMRSVMTDVRGLHPMAEISLEMDESLSERELKVCGMALRSAIVEAVSNAYEFSRKPITIVVKDLGQECSVSILDEGKALSEEALEMALEPFYSARPRHVGVGLSIANRCVVDRGGRMSLSSADGRNCMEVVLPYMQTQG